MEGLRDDYIDDRDYGWDEESRHAPRDNPWDDVVDLGVRSGVTGYDTRSPW